MANIDKVEKMVNFLMNQFQTGEFEYTVARTVIEPKLGDKPSNKWSWLNVWNMLMHKTNDARGCKQWNAVNRKVKKGEKSYIDLCVPNFKTINTKAIEKNELTGEEKEVKKTFQKLIGFSFVPIFAMEQTEQMEGKPVIETSPNYTPNQLPPLYDVAKHWELKVEYVPCLSNWYGCTDTKNYIQLATHDEKTFFHELAHVAHEKIGKLDRSRNAECEIIADFSAAILCNLYNIKGYESHVWNYIRNYANENDSNRVLMKVGNLVKEVCEVVKYILEANEELQNAEYVAEMNANVA